MVTVQQPTRRTIWEVYKLQLDHNGKLSRFDVAVDLFSEQEPELIQDYLGQHMLLKYRRPGYMLDIDDTVKTSILHHASE